MESACQVEGYSDDETADNDDLIILNSYLLFVDVSSLFLQSFRLLLPHKQKFDMIPLQTEVKVCRNYLCLNVSLIVVRRLN